MIEVRCLLRADDVRWETTESLMLEIGYPGRNGPTLWKHTARVSEQQPGWAKTFVHALWQRETAALMLIFEFLPAWSPGARSAEQAFCYRVHATATDGRVHAHKMKMVEGPYTDLFFAFQPRYPGTNT